MGSDEAQRDPRMMRVSHADRDRVVEILRDAAGEGRLEADELDQRVEAALTARTFADFEELVADLPTADPPRPVSTLPAVPAASSPAPVDAAADGAVRWEVRGLQLRREGAWQVPELLELDVAGGSARLDYSQARLPEGGSSVLRVAVHGGSVRLILPAGIAVDTSGVEGYGGRVRDRASRRAVPGAPAGHVITVVGEIHGGSLKILPVSANPRGHHHDRHARRREARNRRI
ncbi:DUF1707 SHOCT-like domain-containing protein [Actinospica robiniae]|uniref:DUF1707 SHOCT-like domain-containing protein n=1 Tax=Actinospica robiniae TaxID=304901 RepID=UPI00040AB72B|nr:DUF1707 domain-containing protein [Actinospica robiniae]